MFNLQFFDKELVCEQCGKSFTWSAGEQEFFAVMGFDNDPRRCPDCREERRLIMMKKGSVRHEVKCARCGKTTKVPFIPHQDRPVYCRSCLDKVRADKAASAA